MQHRLKYILIKNLLLVFLSFTIKESYSALDYKGGWKYPPKNGMYTYVSKLALIGKRAPARFQAHLYTPGKDNNILT